MRALVWLGLITACAAIYITEKTVSVDQFREDNIRITNSGILELRGSKDVHIGQVFRNKGLFLVQGTDEKGGEGSADHRITFDLQGRFINQGSFIILYPSGASASQVELKTLRRMINMSDMWFFLGSSKIGDSSNVVILAYEGCFNLGSITFWGSSSIPISIRITLMDMVPTNILVNLGTVCLKLSTWMPEGVIAGNGCIVLLSEATLHLSDKTKFEDGQKIFLNPSAQATVTYTQFSSSSSRRFNLHGFSRFSLIKFEPPMKLFLFRKGFMMFTVNGKTVSLAMFVGEQYDPDKFLFTGVSIHYTGDAEIRESEKCVCHTLLQK